MAQSPTTRERLEAAARLAYGAERAAGLAAALEPLARAIDGVMAFPLPEEREPFPTGPRAEERQR